MLVHMFPGQGSQRKGMGEALFDEVDEFRMIEGKIDALLGYSIRELCLTDPLGQLRDTRYTQPALFIVNALHQYKATRTGARPVLFVGHSLGEYNALLAAEAFDFITGIRLVKKRGELMAEARDGAMSAVIDLDAEKIVGVLAKNGLADVDIANFNSPSQIVISGSPSLLKKAAPLLEAAGARMCVPLPVSASFHSRYMVSSAREFERFLSSFSFNALRTPVISNVTARPYPSGSPSPTIASLLVKQMSQPVQWTETVRYVLGTGVADFREIGPGVVLTKLVEQIRKMT